MFVSKVFSSLLIAGTLFASACIGTQSGPVEMIVRVEFDDAGETAVLAIDAVQNFCDSDAEVYTSTAANMFITPVLTSGPGESDASPTDMIIRLVEAEISYEPRNPLAAQIITATRPPIGRSGLDVNTEQNVYFTFLSLEQKASWIADMENVGEIIEGGGPYFPIEYDYTITLRYTVNNSETVHEFEHTGAIEIGNFNNC